MSETLAEAIAVQWAANPDGMLYPEGVAATALDWVAEKLAAVETRDAASDAMRKSRLLWGLHDYLQSDAGRQGQFWDEAATTALAAVRGELLGEADQ